MSTTIPFLIQIKNGSVLAPKRDLPTRLNGTRGMLQSIIQRKSLLASILSRIGKIDIVLDDEECEPMNELFPLQSNFSTTVEAIEGEFFPAQNIA